VPDSVPGGWPNVSIEGGRGYGKRPFQKLAAEIAHGRLIAINENGILDGLLAGVNADDFHRVVVCARRPVSAIDVAARAADAVACM
jgi:hypothetical protein